MKKIMTILVALLVGMTAVAQNGWISQEQKADELRGIDAYTLHLYEVSEFAAFYNTGGNKGSIVCLYTKEGIFDYNRDELVEGVLVGYYRDGKLVDKEEITTIMSDGGNCIGFHYEIGGRIIDWLENGGDVRVVAPRYNRSDLDVTIPHRK